ncbi:hypothetical protein MHLP_04485 [Candidatus Mycoplasma haematolamae str. Purdue]|uniref:Uncharacterized protein n=1 Tax=Mycoplasma haematolamae (strain Purdue) TaxID=1212765 RepID=I7C7G5_MYCHA|nr:hypothetical protein [Candidatus Mycoplasma haematolamae]AFO52477.1 hypothetical protein MHLP_04485 [Candidatus Mycoplasma haematolamae str. Purdue]
MTYLGESPVFRVIEYAQSVTPRDSSLLVDGKFKVLTNINFFEYSAAVSHGLSEGDKKGWTPLTIGDPCDSKDSSFNCFELWYLASEAPLNKEFIATNKWRNWSVPLTTYFDFQSKWRPKGKELEHNRFLEILRTGAKELKIKKEIPVQDSYEFNLKGLLDKPFVENIELLEKLEFGSLKSKESVKKERVSFVFSTYREISSGGPVLSISRSEKESSEWLLDGEGSLVFFELDRPEKVFKEIPLKVSTVSEGGRRYLYLSNETLEEWKSFVHNRGGIEMNFNILTRNRKISLRVNWEIEPISELENIEGRVKAWLNPDDILLEKHKPDYHWIAERL